MCFRTDPAHSCPSTWELGESVVRKATLLLALVELNLSAAETDI